MRQKLNQMANFEYTTVLRSEEDDEGNLYLIGVASSDSLDKYDTIFSEECQRGFVEDINNLNVIAEIEHNGSKDFTSRIGKVFDSSVSRSKDKTELVTKIKLNKKNPLAKYIHEVITNPDTEMGEPAQLGLSIRGDIKKRHFEQVNGSLKEVFDRVELKYIGITEKPANKDTFIETIKRSIELEEVKPEEIELSELEIIERNILNTLTEYNKINNSEINSQDKVNLIKSLIERNFNQNNSTENIVELNISEKEEKMADNNVQPEVTQEEVISTPEVMEVETNSVNEEEVKAEETIEEIKEENVERNDNTTDLIEKITSAFNKKLDEVQRNFETLIESKFKEVSESVEKTNKETKEELQRSFDEKMKSTPATKVNNQIGSEITRSVKTELTDEEVLRAFWKMNK